MAEITDRDINFAVGVTAGCDRKPAETAELLAGLMRTRLEFAQIYLHHLVAITLADIGQAKRHARNPGSASQVAAYLDLVEFELGVTPWPKA